MSRSEQPDFIATSIIENRLSQEYERQGGEGPPAELLPYPSGDCKSLPRRLSADSSPSRPRPGPGKVRT